MGKGVQSMKTLYAKKALLTGLIFSVLASIPIALWIAYFFITGKTWGGLFCIIPLLFYNYVGIYKGIKIYCTHWIKYGDGKVIIRRISKNLVNGKPTGKWQKREDEFLLEEIDSYGMSWQVLGQFVEYHLESRRRIASECFFQMKTGKRLGYEVRIYLPEELEEFYRYISEEAGIEFQETSKLRLKTEKI